MNKEELINFIKGLSFHLYLNENVRIADELYEDEIEQIASSIIKNVPEHLDNIYALKDDIIGELYDYNVIGNRVNEDFEFCWNE